MSMRSLRDIDPPTILATRNLNSRGRSFRETGNTNQTKSKIQEELNFNFFGSGSLATFLVLVVDENYYFLTFCEMCSGRRDVNKICKSRSWTKPCGKLQHSSEGFSDYDTFHSSSRISHTFLRQFLAQIKLTTFSN